MSFQVGLGGLGSSADGHGPAVVRHGGRANLSKKELKFLK